MNISVSSLSWGQRFALINAYQPSDADACKALGVTTQELSTARSLVAKGVFQVDSTMNVEPYGILFGRVTTTKPGVDVNVNGSAKKRGRKGEKISECFLNIPVHPIPATELIEKYGVSLPVLRQFKRFDRSGLPGLVNVKKDKTTGVLMVWRDTPVPSTDQ